jgi:UDP-galactopyranose mutase
MVYDFLIVGAGLFGSVFAHEAAAHGKKCLVVDRRGHVGGLAHSETSEGINVHVYGPHVFHTDDAGVWGFVNRFAEFNRFTNSPLANYKGAFYNLPFNMNTFYRLWGVSDPQKAREAVESRREPIPNPKNLEEQALSLVGREIYEMFIKGYTEKQWGRDCRDLPAFIIRRVPLRFTWDNDYFGDRHQGVPIGGYDGMFEKMLADCDVRLGADYSDVRGCFAAAKTVYTGPLDEFYGYRFGALEYRSLRFETEALETPDFQGNAVVNHTDRWTPFTRTVEHGHFEPAPRGSAPRKKTVVTREYPAGHAPGGEPFYPVNDERNEALHARYAELAACEADVIFGGRLADYRYYDMWQVVRNALDAAKKAL